MKWRSVQPLMIAACLMFLTLPSVTLAHSNEYLETITGPHGGKLRMAEQYHFEMVLTDGEVRVWVTDHSDTPQATEGATGNVKLITDTGIVAINLVPAGSNLLLGKSPEVRAKAPAKIIAMIRMKGQPPLQARFAFDVAPRK